MAAYLFQFNPLLQKSLGGTFNSAIASIRNASKKSGNRPRKGAHGRPGHQGIRVKDGAEVKSCTLLVHQHKLNYLPGFNVGFGRIANLYAKVPGKVLVTCEKTDLKDSIQRWFTDQVPPYKKYFNVIPKPPHRRFKLVDKF